MNLIVTTPLAVVVDAGDVTHVRAEDETGAFGVLGGHWTRNLAVDSKGTLFVAIGSNGNINDHDDPHRAAVSVVEPNGKLTQYATGLRNPVGITFYPGTDDLYVVVNERDGEGECAPDRGTRDEGSHGAPASSDRPPIRPGRLPGRREPSGAPDGMEGPLGLSVSDDTGPPHRPGRRRC